MSEDSNSLDDDEKYLSQFVVAKVLSVEPIPNKDNLKRIAVDVGDGDDDDAVVRIVTNAKNVSEAGVLIAIAKGPR